MTARELLVKLGFDVEGKEKLEGAEKLLDGIKSRLDFLIGIEVLKGLAEMTERFVQFGEQLHLASQAAGITVENFQKLTFAASQSGIQQEEMGRSLNILSRRLNEARLGSDMAVRAFKQAGFTHDQIMGFKNSQEAMFALSNRFTQIQDPIKKTALAQELLGRNSAKMVGFLNQGSGAIQAQGKEAERLGMIISERQVEALVSLERALQKVFLLFKSFGAMIASVVAPEFEAIIKDFTEFFAVNREIIQTNIEQWLHGVFFALGFLWEAVKVVTKGFLEFAKVLHIDKYLFTIFMSVLSLVAGFLVLMKTTKGAISLYHELHGILDKVGLIWKFLTAIEWASLGPWLLIAAAIGLTIVALHDLWDAFHGKKTWIESFMEMLGVADFVNNAFMKMFEWIDKIAGKVGSAFGALKSLFGGGDVNVAQKLNLAPQGAAPSSIANNTNTVGGTNVGDVNITMNVPQGTSPHEVGNKVKEGISEHFSRMMRETKRSTASPVAQ